MKSTIKIIIAMVLMLIVILSATACNKSSNSPSSSNETTTQNATTVDDAAIPEATEPGTTTPEAIEPGDNQPEIHEHLWGNWTAIQNSICYGENAQERTCSDCGEREIQNADINHNYAQPQWGICTVCNEAHQFHEHIIENDKCKYCDFEIEVVEVPSAFDNDGDGVNDVYLFAAAFPERFMSDEAIFVNAFDDNLTEINELVFDVYPQQYPIPYKHIYCDKVVVEYLLYDVTVEEAGVYEMAVHVAMKNEKIRGAKYIINEGTENEYSFQTSYEWDTVDEAFDIRNNDFLIGSFMFGIRVELQAGVNTIKIAETDIERNQLFRYFSFVKVED